MKGRLEVWKLGLDNGDEVLFLSAARGFPAADVMRVLGKERARYSFKAKLVRVEYQGDVARVVEPGAERS